MKSKKKKKKKSKKNFSMGSIVCLSIVRFLPHYNSTEDEEFVLFSVLSLCKKIIQSVRVVQGHKKSKLNLKSYSIFGSSGAHHQRDQGCGNYTWQCMPASDLNSSATLVRLPSICFGLSSSDNIYGVVLKIEYVHKVLLRLLTHHQYSLSITCLLKCIKIFIE